jgi:serine/threonine protein kinase
VSLDEDNPCNSFAGTIEYMAPEVIKGDDYGAAVDWWSLGALGFDLLTGNPPFAGNNNAKIQEKIVNSKLSLPYYLSADAKDLLTRLLRKDPKKRLGFNTVKDLATIKKHRFFRKIDWKKLTARELEPPIQPLITDPELAENFAQDFTDLPLSPVLTRKFDDLMDEAQSNPFGGFSYVASESLLTGGEWGDF